MKKSIVCHLLSSTFLFNYQAASFTEQGIRFAACSISDTANPATDGSVDTGSSLDMSIPEREKP
jgi:hypothetical protein